MCGCRTVADQVTVREAECSCVSREKQEDVPLVGLPITYPVASAAKAGQGLAGNSLREVAGCKRLCCRMA